MLIEIPDTPEELLPWMQANGYAIGPITPLVSHIGDWGVVWNGKIASIAHSEVGALAYVVGRYVYQKMAEAEKANANTATVLEQMTARLRSLVLACESGKLVFSTEFSHWDMASFLAESRAALATQPLADS